VGAFKILVGDGAAESSGKKPGCNLEKIYRGGFKQLYKKYEDRLED